MSVLNILAADKSMIAYRPALNKITGSVLATILLQQIIFRWTHNKESEFYKFKAPCNSKLYKEGDSWAEELGFTIYEFDGAIKILKEKSLVSTRIDIQRLTWYSINIEKITDLINATYMGKTDPRKWEKPIYANGQHPIPVNGKNPITELGETNLDHHTEITTKITTDITAENTAPAINKNPLDKVKNHQPIEGDLIEASTSNLPTLINGFNDLEENQGQSQTVKTPIIKEKSFAKKESAATVVTNPLTGELIPVTESLKNDLWAFIQSDGYWTANKSCKTATAALKFAITTAQRQRGLMAQFFEHQASKHHSTQTTPHPARMSKTLGSMWRLQCEMED